jgi:hypothetical protein
VALASFAISNLMNTRHPIDAPPIPYYYVFVVVYMVVDIGPHNFNVEESNAKMKIAM